MKLGLILTLLLLQTTLQTFRHIETQTLSFQVTSPATIVAVSADSLAVSSGPTVHLLSKNKAEPEQTFTSKRNDPQLQAMPSLGQVVFNNDAGLFQLRSQQGDLSLSKPASEKDFPVPSAFRQNILVVPSYEAKPEVLWVNTVTGERKTVSFEGEAGNIEGSSGVTLGPNKFFYLASSGQCDASTGTINLYEGSENGLKIAHKFVLDYCLFNKNNREWKLSSRWEDATQHHLLSYAKNATQPRTISTQLYTKSPDTEGVRLQVEVDRLLGINVVSNNEVYSADGVLCRATLYNVQNYPTIQYSLNSISSLLIYSQDQATIVSLPLKTGAGSPEFELYMVGDKGEPIFDTSIPHPMGIYFVRAEFINNTLIVLLDNEAAIYLYSVTELLFLNETGSLHNIVDFSIGSNSILYVIEEMMDSEMLWAFDFSEEALVEINCTQVYGFKQVFTISDNTVFLAPNGDGIFMIWELIDGEFVNLRDLIKQNDLESEVTIVGGLIIFTSVAHDKPFIYNSLFEEQNIRFNLAPEKNYKIVHSSQTHLLIAVGNDLTNLVSLDCYKLDANENTLVYSGSYPIKSGLGFANLKGILFLPQHDLLYIQYVSPAKRWLTPFKISSPPQTVYGHFLNDEFQDCADHKNAIFSKKGNEVSLLILDIVDFYPVLLKYRVEGSQLVLSQSTFLDKFKASDLKIKLSADEQTLDIYGINRKSLKYSCESRSITTIDTIIYETEYEGNFTDRPLEDSVISNGKVASLFADKLKGEIDIEIKAITQVEVPIRSIFDQITVFSTCIQCNLIAFTGSLNQEASNSTFVSDADTIASPIEIEMDCPAILLALSVRADFLAWVCEDFSLHVYDMSASKVIFDSVEYIDVSSVTFLDDTHLVLKAAGNIEYVPITAPALAQGHVARTIEATDAATVTVNWVQQSYAVNYGDGRIEIFKFAGNKLETISLRNSPIIASLAYNVNGELLALSGSSQIITLGVVPCPQYEEVRQGYCQCLSTFVGDTGSCGCGDQHVLSGNECNCNEGYFYVSATECGDCSFMCDTCVEDGFLTCDSFGAWFYVFVVVLALLLVGIVVVVVLKVKKSKAKENSQFSEEAGSKRKSEKLLSEDPDADEKDDKGK